MTQERNAAKMVEMIGKGTKVLEGRIPQLGDWEKQQEDGTMFERTWKMLTAKAICSVIIAWFLGLHVAMQAMGALLAIDWIVGILSAALHGKLDSTIGLQGIMRKALKVLLVMAIHIVEIYLHQQIGAPGALMIFAPGLAAFFATNELISITENVHKAGIPIPDQIAQFMARIDTTKKGA